MSSQKTLYNYLGYVSGPPAVTADSGAAGRNLGGDELGDGMDY